MNAERRPGKGGAHVSRRLDEAIIPAELRRAGRLVREVVSRAFGASCRDCGRTWTGPTALPHATLHAVDDSHEVVGTYAATYVYRPNGGPS